MTTSLTINRHYVVDTNAVIWYLTNSKKLSLRASEIFTAAEQGKTQLYISSITIAEMYYANQKWALFDDFTQIYNALSSSTYFIFVPFYANEVLDFDRDFNVPEMHDRIITGVARRLNASLVTSDPLIKSSGIAHVEW